MESLRNIYTSLVHLVRQDPNISFVFQGNSYFSESLSLSLNPTLRKIPPENLIAVNNGDLYISYIGLKPDIRQTLKSREYARQVKKSAVLRIMQRHVIQDPRFQIFEKDAILTEEPTILHCQNFSLSQIDKAFYRAYKIFHAKSKRSLALGNPSAEERSFQGITNTFHQ